LMLRLLRSLRSLKLLRSLRSQNMIPPSAAEESLENKW
jgi:hypothetical protein